MCFCAAFHQRDIRKLLLFFYQVNEKHWFEAFVPCGQFKYWPVCRSQSSVVTAAAGLLLNTLNRYAPANWNVIVLSRENALGEDCRRVFRRDVTISFKPATLNWSPYGTCSDKQWMYTLRMDMLRCLCLDRQWVITPSEFALMLQMFLKIWMHQQNWEANCFCSHFETSSDSFRFLVRLLTNFCVLVRLNYVSKQGLFFFYILP